MGSEGFHENEARLSPRTRAIVGLMEELEAIDWYQQRIDATEDAELRDILRHNRDEEMEHASLVLEWILRGPAWPPILTVRSHRSPMTAIPVIDLTPARDDGKSATAADAERRGNDRLRVARQIDDACSSIGFFAITGHGVPDEVIGDLRTVAHAFFNHRITTP